MKTEKMETQKRKAEVLAYRLWPLFGLWSALVATLVLPSLAMAKLNVVATTPDFGAIAQEIGGDKVDVTTLAKSTEDPHFVDAKPSFIVKLNPADAFIEA